MTLEDSTAQTEVIWNAAVMLFEEWRDSPVRLLGIGVTNLSEKAGYQLSLFGDPGHERQVRIDRAVDSIVDRFGADAIGRGLTARPDPPLE